MKFQSRVVFFLATGGYVGRVPVAPGTFGSLAALPLSLLLAQMHPGRSGCVVILFILLAIGISQAAERLLARKDPGCIVIDEMAGILVTFWGLPFSPLWALSGFVVFRVLDILKPWPIRQLEQRIAGGAGVVADDVAAGILGNLLLRAVHLFYMAS